MTIHKWLSKLILPFALPVLAVPMIAASCLVPEYEDEELRTVPSETGETGDTCDTGEESGESGDPARGDDDGDCQCESSSDTGTDPTHPGTDDTGGEGCVLTQGYWKTHNLKADNPNLQEPWPIPEDTQLCDSWIDILWTPPQGDAWIILAHQWIAAELNMAAGADASADVQSAADHAELLLKGCMISATDKPYAIDLSEFLDDYNNGNAGTVPCE